MSGFAAIIDFSGRPVDPAELAAMTAAMAYRGPDGIAHHVDGPVALGHCMLRTTAESLEETQPLANDDGSLVLVMDGYLTNWEELRGELLSRGARLRTRSDAELVLRAYEQWGDDCPRHIDGEYALVIWDGRRREAFCLRDHAGMRPLHYAWNGTRLTIASDIAGVLADRAVPRRLNKAMMAEHMANDWFSLTETLWQDVMRLRGAHRMRVTARGPEMQRHWMPPWEKTLRYRREEDYFEHYRAVLDDSVRRAARTHRPLGCEVSGGLDSSAIFAVADRLAREGRLPAPDIKGYTYSFPAGHPADEGDYARAVAAHVGRHVQAVEPFQPDLAWSAQRGRDDRDYPPFPNNVLAVGTAMAASADGSRVVLNGEGGDELLWGYPLHYHEDLARGDLVAVMRSLAADWRDHGARAALGSFVRHGIFPMAPAPLRALRRRIAANIAVAGDPPEYWMTPPMQHLLRERRAAAEAPEFAAIANRPRRAMFMNLSQGFVAMARDFVSRQSARYGYEYRSPMYSRQYVEFCFQIPENMRLRGGKFKYIHVRALEGQLPDMVISRKTKANFISVARQAAGQIGPLISSGAFADFPEYFENEGLIHLCQQHEAGFGDTDTPWQLWGCFSCWNMLDVNA